MSIRSPGNSLKSIIHLFQAKQGEQPYADPDQAESPVAAPAIAIAHTLLINAFQAAFYMLRAIGYRDAQYEIIALFIACMLYQGLLLAEQRLI